MFMTKQQAAAKVLAVFCTGRDQGLLAVVVSSWFRVCQDAVRERELQEERAKAAANQARVRCGTTGARIYTRGCLAAHNFSQRKLQKRRRGPADSN